MRIQRIADWFVFSLTIVGATAWLANTGAAWGMPAPWADALLGCLAVVASVRALTNRRRASLLFLVPFASVALWTAAAMNPGVSAGREIVGRLVVAGFFLLLPPGVYWYATAGLGWGPTLERRLSLRVLIACTFTIALVAVTGAARLDLRRPMLINCHFVRQPFVAPESEEHVVFQARVLYRGGLEQPRSEADPCVERSWAVAAVEKHYWGLPWWQKHYVILTGLHCTQRADEPTILFIDGRRRAGALTRSLPMVDTYCTRTKPLADAGIDLRVMREGRPRQGVRILGQTVTLTPERRWKAVPFTKLLLRRAGDAQPIETTSDAEGIFDVTGLTPGEYIIGLEADGKIQWFYPPGCMGRQQPRDGDVRDCRVILPRQF